MRKIRLYCGFCSVRPRQLEAQSKRVRFGDKPKNISYSHDYITFYTCTNALAEGINAKTIGSVEFYQRWIDILNPKYLGEDALFLLHKIPVIDGFLKKWGT